jgi:hypothetical protein
METALLAGQCLSMNSSEAIGQIFRWASAPPHECMFLRACGLIEFSYESLNTRVAGHRLVAVRVGRERIIDPAGGSSFCHDVLHTPGDERVVRAKSKTIFSGPQAEQHRPEYPGLSPTFPCNA